jgi:NAD(P)-dependent dehydrogenase (short-subunit alcohol dehydrogenase family)
MAQKTVLIVAASRGLGLGLAREYAGRGWRVIATVRDASKPGGLTELGDAVTIETVDINHTGELLSLRDRLAGTALDLLFVNAGVANGAGEILPDVSTEDFVRTMTTNALSPLRVIESLAKLVTPRGTIAAMTSGLGSVTNNTRGEWEVYRASKAALNTLLRSYGVRSGGERTILAMAPGWVRTDMGGPNAVLDVETSVLGMADTIAAREGTGGVSYVNYLNEVLPW